MTSFYRPPPSCQVPELGALLERLFGQRRDGTFVEVGAFDGETYSNTSMLADLGWRGLYIEPIEAFALECALRHRRNIDVTVVRAAAAAAEGTVTMHLAGALTTSFPRLLDAQAERYGDLEHLGHHRSGTETVPARRLDDMMTAAGIDPGFELLVVDTEGAEPEVFAGLDLGTWRPRALIVELHTGNPDFAETAAASERLRADILGAGYREIYVDIVNTIFERHP